MATAGGIATPNDDGPAINPEITDSINETRKSIEDLIAEISAIGSDINGNYLAEFSRTPSTTGAYPSDTRIASADSLSRLACAGRTP